MDSLPVFLMLNQRPVILLGDGAVADAKARLLERAGARVIRDEAGNARIAIVAIGDAAEAEAAVRRLKARGMLVNAVDRPELCDFTLPAIVDRSPVIIAIGTGASSASLAKALRQRLERILPASLGGVAAALKAARPQLAKRFPEAGGRRSFLDRLLAPGGLLDPLTDHPSPAPVIADALDGEAMPATEKFDEVVLASADPDELTLRAARLLAAADCVYYQPGIPDAIVDRARADAARIAVSQLPDTLLPGRVVFLRWAG